jgi:hypothetical protein
MEFDNNTAVSDEQRRLAEAKKITIQPVHTDIQPDDLPDAEIATRHVLEPAIPNIESDTEQNTMPLQPSGSVLKGNQAASAQRRVVTATIVAVLVGGIALTGIILTR